MALSELARHLYNQASGHQHNFVRRAPIAPLTNGHVPEYHLAGCDGMVCRAVRPWPREVFKRECTEHVAEMEEYLRTHDFELVVE